MKRHLTIGAVAIALALSSCGGDNKKATTTPTPPATAEPPSETATPPTAAGQLPPEFVKCMADQGFEIESQAEMHSAPPEVLQDCFASLHGGGGSLRRIQNEGAPTG